jgi:hypothetical protein
VTREDYIRSLQTRMRANPARKVYTDGFLSNEVDLSRCRGAPFDASCLAAQGGAIRQATL